jgi:hypothetical protein
MALQQGGLAGPSGPLDPRTLTEFMAGAIYHPLLGVTQHLHGGGDPTTYTWQSQATTANSETLLDTAYAFEPPVPGTASDGSACFVKTGSTGGNFVIPVCDACLRPADLFSIGFWIEPSDLAFGNQFLIEQWGEGATDNRTFCYLNNSNGVTPGKISINGSALGYGGDGTSAVNITDATNANPIVITAAGHGFTSGWTARIAGVTGNLAANGDHVVTRIDDDTLSIAVAGNGAYAGSGTIQRRADRWKSNINEDGTEHDFLAAPTFIIIKFDYSLTNYSGGGGEALSNRMKVYFDGALNVGTGFSAPPDSPINYRAPPEGPLFGPALNAQSTRFCYGGNYNGSGMRGALGGLCLASGDVDIPTWMRVAAWLLTDPN